MDDIEIVFDKAEEELFIANVTVRGCRDILPSTTRARRVLVDRFAKMADTYGFCEMETPILERTTLFKRALGSTSDIISSELYHVISTEPDGIVLRPEGTAPVLRAISRYRSTLGTGGTTYGTRIWYTGKMFRHERPSLAHNYLKTTSIPQSNIVLHINTLGSIDDRKVYNDTLKKYLSVSPRYEALSELSQLRVDKGECMRILDSKLSEDIDIMKNAPTLEEFVGNKEKQRSRTRLLHQHGVRIRARKSRRRRRREVFRPLQPLRSRLRDRPGQNRR